MSYGEVGFVLGERKPDPRIGARHTFDTGDVPKFMLSCVQLNETESGSTTAVWFGSFAELSAVADAFRAALDAAWKEHTAGSPLPEPVGNAA